MARQRRRMWRAVAIAWLVAGTLPTMAAAASPPSSPPGYLADDYSSIRLDSNNLWSSTKALGRSYPIGLFPKAAPETTSAVWATTCPASAQTVTFSRNVWLPGPPAPGATFFFAPHVGQRTYLAPGTVDLIVNGERIVHERALSTFRVPFSATGLKAFRFEQNHIQVRVYKRATQGACNTGGQATEMGVSFAISGNFATDLAFNPRTPDDYYKLAPGQSYTPWIKLHFHNLGPDWVPAGKLQLNVSGASRFTLGSGTSVVPAPSAPLTDCQQSQNGPSFLVTCGLSGFAPGTDGTLDSLYQVTAPSSDYSDFSVVYSVYMSPGGLSDLNSADNQNQHVWVFCGSKSTNPGCQNAQSPPHG